MKRDIRRREERWLGKGRRRDTRKREERERKKGRGMRGEERKGNDPR